MEEYGNPAKISRSIITPRYSKLKKTKKSVFSRAYLYAFQRTKYNPWTDAIRVAGDFPYERACADGDRRRHTRGVCSDVQIYNIYMSGCVCVFNLWCRRRINVSRVRTSTEHEDDDNDSNNNNNNSNNNNNTTSLTYSDECAGRVRHFLPPVPHAAA